MHVHARFYPTHAHTIKLKLCPNLLHVHAHSPHLLHAHAHSPNLLHAHAHSPNLLHAHAHATFLFTHMHMLHVYSLMPGKEVSTVFCKQFGFSTISLRILGRFLKDIAGFILKRSFHPYKNSFKHRIDIVFTIFKLSYP